MTHTFGCVVLTEARRPDHLQRAMESVLVQRGVDVDLVVVGNGAKPEDLPDGARVLALPENLGIPAGRNAGIPEATGDLLLFLDDDAYLKGDDFLSRAAEMFDRDPTLGVVQPRVLDPAGVRTPRRFVPRLRVGDDRRSSDVVALWEGVCVVRRSALDKAGAWPDEFFYMHEGVDLTWRVMDAGYRVRYCGDLEAFHPAVDPERHPELHYFGARNRVWLARRNLPIPLAVPYLVTWALIDTLRLRNLRSARQQVRGFFDGVRKPCGTRSPISWRTTWRMTRAGRPPVI
ncbi:MAG: glycosyltransferase family 2 protein [Haloechinothrix sp.]